MDKEYFRVACALGKEDPELRYYASVTRKVLAVGGDGGILYVGRVAVEWVGKRVDWVLYVSPRAAPLPLVTSECPHHLTIRDAKEDIDKEIDRAVLPEFRDSFKAAAEEMRKALRFGYVKALRFGYVVFKV